LKIGPRAMTIRRLGHACPGLLCATRFWRPFFVNLSAFKAKPGTEWY
jgi:hypothetical protein